MKRKSRKIDTVRKRCRELTKFTIGADFDGSAPSFSGVITIEGVYTYGIRRKK